MSTSTPSRLRKLGIRARAYVGAEFNLYLNINPFLEAAVIFSVWWVALSTVTVALGAQLEVPRDVSLAIAGLGVSVAGIFAGVLSLMLTVVQGSLSNAFRSLSGKIINVFAAASATSLLLSPLALGAIAFPEWFSGPLLAGLVAFHLSMVRAFVFLFRILQQEAVRLAQPTRPGRNPDSPVIDLKTGKPVA